MTLFFNLKMFFVYVLVKVSHNEEFISYGEFEKPCLVSACNTEKIPSLTAWV
jgi:hypothetical protein